MKPAARIALALLLAAVLPGAVTVAAGARTAKARPDARVTRAMYDDRYCEYLAVKGAPPNLLATVWNTYGLNDCPPALWNASDATALARELGALRVVLNGPRHWLIDRARIALARTPKEIGTVLSFHGLRMRAIAAVRVPITNGVPGLPPYREVTVKRRNTFVWSHRFPVHELLAPNGRVYVMQAYAQIVDRSLTVAGLRGLGPRLQLPAGWRYRTRRLRRDLALTTTGNATVLQDPLQNSYQRER